MRPKNMVFITEALPIGKCNNCGAMAITEDQGENISCKNCGHLDTDGITFYPKETLLELGLSKEKINKFLNMNEN